MTSFGSFFSALLAISGMQSSAMEPSTEDVLSAHQAHAILMSKSASTATGDVDFTETPAGIQVHYKVSGLQKNSKFGFHIHEKGSCDGADAKGAGHHYLMLSSKGGTSVENPQKFAGDLPEIVTDAKGESEGQFLISGLSMNKVNPIEDHSIIIHGGPDNIHQKAPPRVACGIIKRTKQIAE